VALCFVVFNIRYKTLWLCGEKKLHSPDKSLYYTAFYRIRKHFSRFKHRPAPHADIFAPGYHFDVQSYCACLKF